MRSQETPFHILFVRASAFVVRNVDKRGGSSKHHEVPAEISTYDAIWFTDFLLTVLTSSRTRTTFELFIEIDGEHYEDHRQKSRVHHDSFYASHKPETLILLCHHTLSTTWFLSPLVMSKARHKI